MRHARLNRISPDPLTRLRRLRGDELPDENEVRRATASVLASNDGKVLLNWMIAQSYGRSLPEGADESALRANEVRKKFLDQIMALAEEPRASRQSDTKSAGRRSRKPG